MALGENVDGAGEDGSDAAASAGGTVASGRVILGDRFEIDPKRPIPQLDSPGAEAFAAIDLNGDSRLLYALLLDGRIPVRSRVMTTLQEASLDTVVRPVQWGSVGWPGAGERRLAILCTHPGGARLVASKEETFEPVPASRLIANYAKPLTASLKEMSDCRVAHRAVRLTNLFRRSADGVLVFGECFSSPPGCHQPVVYEPIERALAHPQARGDGSVIDDLYALGVTLLGLSAGRTPLIEYGDQQIIEARLAKGSFAVLTSGIWMPQELAEALRGLLRDDPAERWDLDQVEAWLSGRRRHMVVPNNEFRAELPFRFGGVMHYNPRGLAVALNDNWTTAVDIARSGKLLEWARRSLKDQQCAEALAEVTQSKGGPRLINDDLLVARTLIALDPAAPIRYDGFSVMPDGFGPAFAFAIEGQTAARALIGIFQGMLPGYWMRLQANRDTAIATAQDYAANIGRYLGQTAPGVHLERCLYELNPIYPCRSGLVADAVVADLLSLLEALDAGAGGKSAQGDRHVLAFLAARLPGGVDMSLTKMASGSPAEQMLGFLRLLAEAQEKAGAAKLPKLCKAFAANLKPVVLSYRNRQLRVRMQQAIERAAGDGSLRGLLAIVNRTSERETDAAGYRAARVRYGRLRFALQLLRQAESRRDADALKLGHKLAAYVSGVICAVATTVIIMQALG